MPWPFSARAAASASSTRSPGQNLRTERRTNAALVARSRSQAFVELASSTFRITLMEWQPVDWRAAVRSSQHALDQAAIHLHRRAGHVARGRREQKRSHPAVFLDLAVTPGRDCGQRLALGFFGGDVLPGGGDLIELPHTVGVDPPRDDL